MFNRHAVLAVTALILGTSAALAQTTPPNATQSSTEQPTATPAALSPAAPSQTTSSQTAPAKASDSLAVYFGPGSSAITPESQRVLDQAARTYREGKPIIMVVSGGSDSTGSPSANLRLSQIRADNVLQGLLARGIPVDRFQVLAKGETEPAVPTPEGTAEARNRRVEISWR